MTEQLYRKVQKGKTVRYEPVIEDDTVTTVEFTDRECLTVAASLGIVLLMMIERTRAKTKNGGSSFFERKIRDVRTAIAELFRETGEQLRLDISEGVMRCWDETMQRIANEGIDDKLIRVRS